MSDALHCRSCGSAELDDLGPCARPVSAAEAGIDPGHLLRCRQCGLGQRHPIPDADAIAAMYTDASPEAMAYDYERSQCGVGAGPAVVARALRQPARRGSA
ncbi:MAG: hypothetical protein IT472_04870 [Thermomonas sp.]|uniref:hypothetical protein n=1 Tax=Thermomonas sp. TaxID=1971895 RepID=UPI00262316AB|nr:hypothetical protein [Thermomonas sp.]MCC7096489.1 hypothetical protein [Thermomonas sp.]